MAWMPYKEDETASKSKRGVYVKRKPKMLTFNGIKVPVLNLVQIGYILDIRKETVLSWVTKGWILPPIIKGREIKSKFKNKEAIKGRVNYYLTAEIDYFISLYLDMKEYEKTGLSEEFRAKLKVGWEKIRKSFQETVLEETRGDKNE